MQIRFSQLFAKNQLFFIYIIDNKNIVILYGIIVENVINIT